MLLKHLTGSKTQDIYQAHGVSRSTVVETIVSTMDAIIAEFPIEPFPFNDEVAEIYWVRFVDGLTKFL